MAAILMAATVPRVEGHDGCHSKSCRQRVERKHWTHLQRMLPRATKRMLARLRGCETRGIPFPKNYQWRGHHWGAYQYLPSTAARAGFKRPVYLTSPAEQDVRTARYIARHGAGEWACRV